jgi:hypothetical protein
MKGDGVLIWKTRTGLELSAVLGLSQAGTGGDTETDSIRRSMKNWGLRNRRFIRLHRYAKSVLRDFAQVTQQYYEARLRNTL